jgi:hypothetical protein
MEYFDGAGVKWAGGFDWRWNQRPEYLDGAGCPMGCNIWDEAGVKSAGLFGVDRSERAGLLGGSCRLEYLDLTGVERAGFSGWSCSQMGWNIRIERGSWSQIGWNI